MSLSVDSLTTVLSELSISNMNTIQAAKEIANTLRHFSGKSEHLESFINSVDKFYDRYGKTTDNSLSEFVFAAISSKIVDEAGDFLLCRPDLGTWPEIKKALRDKFGDKIDRHVLQQQFIFLTKNKNEHISDFLERLKLIKMKLNLKINADTQINTATKAALIEQNEVTAVTILMSNVNIELRTLLMLKNPKNIDEATSLVINHSLIEQQINLRHQSYKPIQKPVPNYHNNKVQYNYHQRPTFGHQTNFSNLQNNYPQHSFNNNFNPRPTFPSQPIKIESRPVQQKYFSNAQVFGKPTNVFSPKNSHKPQNKPEPMSTTSRLPSVRNSNQHFKQNFFQRTGPSNFMSQELTNLETNNPDNYNNDDDFNSLQTNYENNYSNETFESENYLVNEDYPNDNQLENHLETNEQNFCITESQIDTS